MLQIYISMANPVDKSELCGSEEQSSINMQAEILSFHDKKKSKAGIEILGTLRGLFQRYFFRVV